MWCRRAALPEEEVRAMLLVRACGLTKGFSGVAPELLEMLLALLEFHVRRIHAARGSGRRQRQSGSTCTCTYGPRDHRRRAGSCRQKAASSGLRDGAVVQAGLKPLVLEAREALALLNANPGGESNWRAGAGAGLARGGAGGALGWSDDAGGPEGTPTPFDERIHAVRPHPGQMATAAHLRALSRKARFAQPHRHNDPRVQDAYCLRCMPQVHGAVRDALGKRGRRWRLKPVRRLIIRWFSRGGDSFGGNFHGARLSLALDPSAIALTTLMGIGSAA